jgi:hypothetical protein
MTSAFVKVDAKQDKFRKTYTFLSTEKMVLGWENLQMLAWLNAGFGVWMNSTG